MTTYATGTAFFLRVDGVDFLVTARHNLTGRDLVNDRPLSSRGVSPTHIGIGFWPTQPPGGYQLAEGIAVQLFELPRRTATALDDDTDSQHIAGHSENERARSATATVRNTARAQADAIAPAARSPAGAKLLVSRMDERLTAMKREIDTAKAQQRALATRLRQLAAAYRMTAPQTAVALSRSQFRPTISGPIATAVRYGRAAAPPRNKGACNQPTVRHS